MLLIGALALLILVFCSAAFAGAEAALTALSALKMKRLAAQDSRLSGHLAEWLDKPHRLLVTILVGNNLVNVAISSLAAYLALPLAKILSARLVEILVWFFTTVVLLIFAEILPKILSRAHAEKVSVWTLPPLSALTKFFSYIFSPLYKLLGRFSRALESAPVNRLTALSLEELRHIIQESESTGQVPRESGEMMNRLINLPQRTVGDICQPAASVDTVALEVLDRPVDGGELFIDLLVESGRTRVPVTRVGVPVGFVHVIDLLKESHGGRPQDLAAMVRPARFVPPSKPVFDVLLDFQKSGDHVIFVENENSEFVGLATLEDVLEEIVGEILDEYDLERKKE